MRTLRSVFPVTTQLIIVSCFLFSANVNGTRFGKSDSNSFTGLGTRSTSNAAAAIAIEARA